MAVQVGPTVQAKRDLNGRVIHLNHILAPFTSPREPSIEALARAYVDEVAEIYGLGAVGVANVQNEPGEGLRLAQVKSVKETTVVSFVQMHHGLPIWEAGLSVVVHGRPLRVTSSTCSVHFGVQAPPVDDALFGPEKLDEARLAEVLGVPGALRVNRTRALIYRYDPARRIDPEAHPELPHGPLEAPPPVLRLPPVEGVPPGAHVVVTEVLFTLQQGRQGEIHWRAFVEAKTGSVLYLRAFVAHATGSVFVTDPLTATGGTTPASSAAVLNPLRSFVTLPALDTPPPMAPQALTGPYVRVVDISAPGATPPTAGDGVFVYGADTDDFSAVNAYHHCHGFFALMEDMGFDVPTFFDGTAATPGFPVPVDHRALGNTVNAQGPGNMFGDGSNGFRFALAQLGTTVGIAGDHRVVAHEFCHALLWDSVHSPNFGFAHSAGDALGAILNDPGSRAPDRFATFPWIAAGTPGLARRHDRPVGGGWGWGGSFDGGGYLSEQILATTLFRAYRAAGGDSTEVDPTRRLADQREAARWLSYLTIRAIGSLGSSTIVPTPEPDIFATALMNADVGTTLFDQKPGGLLHKVIRWAFEQQGLYQPLGAPTTVSTPGAPPEVDVFIDDGRGGAYLPYLEDIAASTEIWNRRTPGLSTSPTDNETPLAGVSNHLFVRIRNRGQQRAQDVVVRGFRARPGSGRIWPSDWAPVGEIAVPAGVPAGGSVVVGPFKWTPRGQEEVVLFAVGATGDPAHIDAASALPAGTGPTRDDHLVRLDNNIAERRFAVAPNPDPCAVEVPEIEGCCVSPCGPPWLPLDQCLTWYEGRVVRAPRNVVVRTEDGRVVGILVVRITFEHCLKMRGRRQGPLLYTTSLLPGEEVSLYHYERYRRTRSHTDTYSVHTSLRQYVAAQAGSSTIQENAGFQRLLVNIRADGDTSISMGGQLFPAGWNADDHDTAIGYQQEASTREVTQTFNQQLVTSASLVEAERSVTVSTFEDAETRDVTVRRLRNANECYAVTYFVRRVLEVYQLTTRVARVEWRLVTKEGPGLPWQSIEEPMPPEVQVVLDTLSLPRVGEEVQGGHEVVLSTDGVVYEAELAHCSSCEPHREVQHRIELQRQQALAHRACVETRLLELELERRRLLLEAGRLDPFDPPT
jgi:hypothetical protein